MRQCHVSHSHLIQQAQDSKVAVDAMPRLHTDEAGNLATCHCSLNLISSKTECHVVRIVIYQSLDNVNLF